MEQNVDIPVAGGGLHVLPDPGGSSSSAVSRDERGEGFFSDFSPGQQKSEVRRQSEPEGARQVELMDSGGLCGRSGRGRVRRVLRLQRRLVQAGLGPAVSSVIGAKSVVKMATASCRCMCRLGSSSSDLSDVEPPRYIVMAL